MSNRVNSMIYRLCGKRDEITKIIEYLTEKREALDVQITDMIKETKE